MVKNIFAKKKKAEAEVLANGRIILTDFKKLKKGDYPNYGDGIMFFLHYDGKIYFDSKNEFTEALIIAYKPLVECSRADLREWERQRKKRYPHIKTVEDLAKLQGNNEDFLKALSMFFVDTEMRRRQIERSYYG